MPSHRHSHHSHGWGHGHATAGTPGSHDCHDGDPHSSESGPHASNSCCLGLHSRSREQLEKANSSSDEAAESGQVAANFERIVLTIDGLKCGCCGNGISRAAKNIPAIKNHRVNVVLARVEFDLDTSHVTVADVIKNLNTATGYIFKEHIQPDGQILELLVSNPTEIYNAGRPYGVTLLDAGAKHFWSPARLLSGRTSRVGSRRASHMDQPGDLSAPGKTLGNSLYQHTVRVYYNATKIGARDVLEYYQQLAPSQKLELAPPAAHPSLAIGAKQTRRACEVFFISLVFTVPVLILAWTPGIDHKAMIHAHISLALATIVQVLAIREFVPGAFRSIIHSGLFEMDFLITLSTTIAYVFSVVSYVFQIHNRPLETGSFFETSTLLVTLILLGRVVNEFARLRAAKSVSFRSLQAEEALLVLACGRIEPERETRRIDARLLQYGDSFKVPPHTRIVTDGKVKYGGSEVDESMITGESVPVGKGLGQKVYAGTNNGSGLLIVELTKLPHENSISKIACMVENAELTKPKVQALADRIAGWFVPTITGIGLLVFIIWLIVARRVSGRSPRDALVKALTYAIATLIVSCPCAIGIAVPMVVLIAGGVSARFSIIFRDPQKLEVARNVTDVIFDKTGTLTTGTLEVVEETFQGPHSIQTKSRLLGLLRDNNHPVAIAVLRWLQEGSRPDSLHPVNPSEMINIRSIPGGGVVGTCKASGLEVRAGNPQWLGIVTLDSAHTLFCVTVETPAEIESTASSFPGPGMPRQMCATFRLQDCTRHTASAVVQLLTERGIRVHMISGDGEGAVNEVAHALNISKTSTRHRLRPEDKQEYVRDIQGAGKVVMFVGDGTNDSVALRQADVGVHINQGSDIAKSASDVVLMTTRLHDVLVLLDISRAAYRRIIINFSWSAIYNVVAILMAAGAFVKIRIPPAYAGLGELVSVLPVVLIAFQMRWRNYAKQYRATEYDFLQKD